MDEIAKLYENAGVLKECLSPCYINKIWRKTHDCPNCDNRKNYPPFTAEKQIEFCKWLIKNYRRYVFDVIEADSFETDLAKFMNEEWQDLTEEEKQQVKGILE